MKKRKSETPAEPVNKFRTRWQRINEIQIEEERQRTPEERVRRFFALMALAKQMGWQTHTPEEIDRVRQIWIKAKKKHGKK